MEKCLPENKELKSPDFTNLKNLFFQLEMDGPIYKFISINNEGIVTGMEVGVSFFKDIHIDKIVLWVTINKAIILLKEIRLEASKDFMLLASSLSINNIKYSIAF